MTPQELALEIKEELTEALADTALSERWSVIDVVPPTLLDADSHLSVILATSDRAADRNMAELALPSSLAIGYLADEEAAVDEWRLWIEEIAKRLAS